MVKEVSDQWRAQSIDLHLSVHFAIKELYSALQQPKASKAPGPDNICPEIILHASDKLKAWFHDFPFSCLHHLGIPKIWLRAIVVETPKLNKPSNDAKTYHPISLLCVPFKTIKCLIHSCIVPVIYSLLPPEQARFHHGRSTVDQVTLLTQHFKDSFEAKKKAGAIFVDLTAAYNTMWHHGSLVNCCIFYQTSTWSK